MLSVGRVGSAGGSRGRAVAPAASPDFTLSNASVATVWGIANVGTLTPINADPNDVIFEVVYSTAASGDEAGFTAVNG